MPITLALVRVLGDDRLDVNTRDINVGLAYLATYARYAGAETSLYDPVEVSDDKNDPIYEQLASFNVVGFSIHCLNVEQTLRLIVRIKQLAPDLLVVAGGHHAGACARELLDDYPEIDVVCIGDGEYPIRDICSAPDKFRRRTSSSGIMVRGGAPSDLDLLLAPSRDSVSRIERISTSRGCPYRCTFCTTPGIISLSGQAQYRCRSVSNVVDELFTLYRQGSRHFYINDDIFVIGNKNSRRRALAFADKVLSMGAKITYKAQLRADSFAIDEPDQLQQLRASGMTEVFLGVESGSDRTLSEYRKDITRATSASAIRMYRELGIKVNAGNIPASPNALLTDFVDTVDFFAEVDMAFLLFRRVSFKALVFPGTEIERNLAASGRLRRTKRYLLGDYQFLDPLLERLIEHLEPRMPDFLRMVGGDIFAARNDCWREMDQWNEDAQSRFQSTMAAWSTVSHDAISKLISLVTCHADSAERVDAVISDYSTDCIRLLHDLTLLRGKLTTAEMSGDLF